MHRRLPKFGFTNPFRIEYQEVNVSRLQELASVLGETQEPITSEVLFAHKVIRNKKKPVKVLGNGEISAKLQVQADKFTASAKQKIESAGGTVITNE